MICNEWVWFVQECKDREFINITFYINRLIEKNGKTNNGKKNTEEIKTSAYFLMVKHTDLSPKVIMLIKGKNL